VTDIGANEASAGDELMMLVVTTVKQLADSNPHAGSVVLGTNGVGEGYAAADLYRIEGHPMTVDNTRMPVDTAIPLAKSGW
jgi:hypothetical protein